MHDSPVNAAAGAAARDAYGRLVAALAARTGDIAAAQDALGDAFAAALRHWPHTGVPDNPAAWLLTAARRRQIDAARRARPYPLADHDQPAHNAMNPLEQLEAADAPTIGDRRLDLLFACAHPAIDESSRAPLVLQAVMGLDTPAIASAFALSPATLSQRLLRAKNKIKDAGIRLTLPPQDQLTPRLACVLDTLYAAFNAGCDGHDNDGYTPRPLIAESIHLARLIAHDLPDQPEALGLYALMLHIHARSQARRDTADRFVPLDRQDTSRWDTGAIREADRAIIAAATLRNPGRYQLEAAIQSAHTHGLLNDGRDWPAIADLYDLLCTISPTLGARVARAAAHAEASGPDRGLTMLDQLPPTLTASHQPYWVTRAALLGRAGQATQAAAALRRAIDLTTDTAVRDYLLTQQPPG